MSRWTEGEDELLKVRYPFTSRDELLNILPNHTWNAIKVRAHQEFGLKKDRFQRVRDRGLRPWTDEEVEALKRIYPVKYTDEIMEALPNHSWFSIETKAMELEIKRMLDRRFGAIKSIKLPESDLSYIAAMIDGEGSITISKLERGGYVSGISIANKCLSMLEWIKSRIKRGGISPKSPESPDSTCYSLKIARNSDQIALLEAVMPYLKVKHRRAEFALDFLKAQRKMLRTQLLKDGRAHGTRVTHHPDERKAYERYIAYREHGESSCL